MKLSNFAAVTNPNAKCSVHLATVRANWLLFSSTCLMVAHFPRHSVKSLSPTEGFLLFPNMFLLKRSLCNNLPTRQESN